MASIETRVLANSDKRPVGAAHASAFARLSRLMSTRAYKWITATAAAGLLIANLAIGVFALGLQQNITDLALSIYDSSFLPSSYLYRADVAFQRFLDQRSAARDKTEISAANSQLSEAIDDLEVAIENSNSQRIRGDGARLRSEMAALRDASPDRLNSGFDLNMVQSQLEGLAKHTAAIGLAARDKVEAGGSNSRSLLFGSIVGSILLAGLSLFILRRVTDRRTSEQLTQMATFDPLTGLPNRTLLGPRIQAAIDGSRSDDGCFGLLSVDLDRFKQVNDTLGHLVGDRLLIEVARRINARLRVTDMAARFGGDEFVILQQPLHDPAHAGVLADRLVADLSEAYFIDDQRIVIGASVGIAVYPKDGDDVEDLLRHSDVALYRAKFDGKGRRLYFSPDMNDALQSRRLLELDLREAIERGELFVYYQPLIEILSGRVSTCEALVRWIHPRRGMVSPNDFIPLAEENGLIVPIGELVLRTACAEAATWSDSIKIAVNLSAVQFRSPDLVARVTAILAETGLEPERLELEITESILIADKDRVMNTLHALRSLGVRIALDDFGTGYSSLAYLTSFPFDKIKIDRTFVRDVPDRPESAAIVRAILSLAETLNLSTTAEGVEQTDQLDWLRANGCQQAQGFLYSRPVPAGDLGPMMSMGRSSGHGDRPFGSVAA
jgi:diguanylate cyclase (GGDEF)-like protein